MIVSLRTSVNTMAANLTNQVRGFAQISAAAMSGDFSNTMDVAAAGEMNSLKEQINSMVLNLRESIQRNNSAREAAELANRTKSEFLANMSHEIRRVFLYYYHSSLMSSQNPYERYHRNDGAYSRQRVESLAEREPASCA